VTSPWGRERIGMITVPPVCYLDVLDIPVWVKFEIIAIPSDNSSVIIHRPSCVRIRWRGGYTLEQIGIVDPCNRGIPAKQKLIREGLFRVKLRTYLLTHCVLSVQHPSPGFAPTQVAPGATSPDGGGFVIWHLQVPHVFSQLLCM